MASRDPAAKLTCPICSNTLDLIPVEVGPTSIRYEVRCTVVHTEAQLKKATESLGSAVRP
jgi:hypothetical protein